MTEELNVEGSDTTDGDSSTVAQGKIITVPKEAASGGCGGATGVFLVFL